MRTALRTPETPRLAYKRTDSSLQRLALLPQVPQAPPETPLRLELKLRSRPALISVYLSSFAPLCRTCAARVVILSSLLFVKRLNVNEADIATTNLNAINDVSFAPFSSVTFGAVARVVSTTLPPTNLGSGSRRKAVRPVSTVAPRPGMGVSDVWNHGFQS